MSHPLKNIIPFCATLLLVFLSTEIHLTEAETYTDITNVTSSVESYSLLRRRILSHPLVTDKVPLSVTGHTHISMTFMPFQILSVDEVDQTIQISALVLFFWNASQLAWDPGDYGNLTCVYLDASSVWVPEIVSTKGVGRPNIDFPKVIQLNPDHFLAKVPTDIWTTCDLDLQYFPYDSHNCSILFKEVYEYSIEPKPYPGFIDSLTDYFSTTTEWKFLGSGCAPIRPQVLDGMCPSGMKMPRGDGKPESDFVYTECWIMMERRSLFYVVLVIVPIVTMDAMALFVFVIPPQAGEKVSYIVSIFVSLAIFNVYVNDVIPRSMNDVPKIVIFIGLVHFKIVWCMLATFFVLHRYQSDEEREQDEHTEIEMNGKETSETTIIETTRDQNHIVVASKTQHEKAIEVNPFFIMKPNQVDAIKNTDITQDGGELKDTSLGPRKTTDRFKFPRDVLTKLFKSRMTASQMDKCFFVVFLLAGIYMYSKIIH